MPITRDEPSDIVKRIIRGMASDIDDNARLPDHTTVLFKRPAAVFPDDCPLMCVWLLQKAYTPTGTKLLENAIGIGISWQVEGIDRAETLKDDPNKHEDMLDAVAKIEWRVRAMGALLGDYEQTEFVPGVPEVDMVLPVSVDYIPPLSIETGLVEGYAMAVEVDVRE